MSVQPPAQWASPPPARPAPLDQPQYQATIGQAVSRYWRKYATFSGRASRTEYWWWALVSFVVSVVLQIIGSVALGGSLFRVTPNPVLDLRSFVLPLVPALIWSLITFVPSLALAVRRLHDTNRRGWWYLLSLPSLIGATIQIRGFASVDPERMAAGDLSGIAIAPLVVGGLLSLLGLVGSIVVLVFFILEPDPRGARFDRQG